jgi:uncharacterized protein (DUF1330 family)
MKSSAVMPGLALAMLLAFAAFWTWQTPGWLRGALTLEEVDYHFGLMEKNLAMPADDKDELLARLRAWALADDGEPVFMLNLMRYYPQLLDFDGAPDFGGTPEESNALYERAVTPMALSSGSYPLYIGTTQGENLIEHAAALDNWSRVIVMRYPSRRAVLELFADPEYAPWEPYKMMALRVVLVPTHSEMVVPELRWLVGGILLLIFMTTGWLRTARRR